MRPSETPQAECRAKSCSTIPATGTNHLSSARSTTWSLLLCALSMSLGWRIRGQFGHEIGAAIAGALGAMSLVLASGREDWRRRIHFFAFLGGIGWSFGGSMSYMKVVAFTHSSDSDTVLYGFAGLFLIGFLWAALGGAGTALAAALSTQQLAEIFPALVTLLAAWWLQGPVTDWYVSAGGTIHNWYDSDWLEAAVAIAAMVFLLLIRRRTDVGTSLVLCLTVGWWIGFLVLVNGLGWRLNPPRGDNWAGCMGIFGGLMVFCRCYRLGAVAFVPENWLGRSQLLYLVFLWAFAFLSFAIEISGTLPGWFVTQWFITLHALLCTWLMLASPVFAHVPQHATTNFAKPIRRVVSAGLLALLIISFSGWGLKRFLFAGTFAGYFNSNHVRFGPHNTNNMK